MKRTAIILLAILAATAVKAQKPSIGFVHPCGAKPGSTLEITLGGQNIAKVTEAMISGDGITSEVIIDNSEEGKKRNKISKKNIGDEDNLQIAQRIKVRLNISKDAKPGLRDLRVVSDKGVSNRLFFEIGQFDNVLEAEPNSDLQHANKVDNLPSTLCGQIMMSDKDFWSFKAKKGADIVIDVKARLFTPYIADAVPGWFQPILTLYNEKGKEVAYCDDYRFRVDPLIIFKVPETGTYILEIKDALYRGREDFTYRIDIGELPYITSISPIGGLAGKNTKVEVHGVNLPQNTMTVSPSRKQHGKMMVSMTGRNGIRSNAVPFDVGDRDLIEYTRPDSDTKIEVDLGQVITGRFTRPCEQHVYFLNIEKRTQLVVEIKARRVDAPTDAKIEILRNGQIVASNSDFEDQTEGYMTQFADPMVMYRAQPGTYTIRVSEEQNHYGDEYEYRMYVTKRIPDFEVTCSPGVISVPRGGSATINMAAIRKYRFAGSIQTRFEGLPHGFETSFSTMEKNEKKRTVVVTAPMSAKEGLASVKIFGEAENPATHERMIREAHPVETLTQAFAWDHDVAASDLQLRILPPQPFSLKIKSPSSVVQYHLGDIVPIEVEIIRRDGYKEPIQLMVKGAKTGKAMEAVPVTATADQKSATINVKFNWWKTGSATSIIINGNVKGSAKRVQGQKRDAFTASVSAIAPAVVIRMPSEKSPLDPSLKKKKNLPKRDTKNSK